jgi:hypothetical protein
MIAELPYPVCDGIHGISRAAQNAEQNQWFRDNIGEPITKCKDSKFLSGFYISTRIWEEIRLNILVIGFLLQTQS